jgi:hypothetical protein
VSVQGRIGVRGKNWCQFIFRVKQLNCHRFQLSDVMASARPGRRQCPDLSRSNLEALNRSTFSKRQWSPRCYTTTDLSDPTAVGISGSNGPHGYAPRDDTRRCGSFPPGPWRAITRDQAQLDWSLKVPRTTKDSPASISRSQAPALFRPRSD